MKDIRIRHKERLLLVSWRQRKMHNATTILSAEMNKHSKVQAKHQIEKKNFKNPEFLRCPFIIIIIIKCL